MDARVIGKKFVGAGDWVRAQFILFDGVNLVPRRERLGHFAPGVARLHDVARQQAGQSTIGAHHRERAKGEPALFDHVQHFANEMFGRDFDWILNQTVHVVLHAAQFGKLLLLRHVVVDEAEPAVQRHGDGHPGFGHRVHVRRDDRDVEAQSFRQLGVELRVARKDFRIKRGQRHIVVGERQTPVRSEKGLSRLVEFGVDCVELLLECHVG